MSTNQLLEHLYTKLSKKLKCDEANIETSCLLYNVICESLDIQDNVVSVFDIVSNDNMSNEFFENVQPIYLTPIKKTVYTRDYHHLTDDAEHKEDIKMSRFLFLEKDDPIFTPTPRLELCDAKLEKMCRNQRGIYIDDDDVVAPINFEQLNKATAPNKTFA